MKRLELTDLPDELLIKILKHLYYSDWISLKMTCQKLYRIAEDNQLWGKFFSPVHKVPRNYYYLEACNSFKSVLLSNPFGALIAITRDHATLKWAPEDIQNNRRLALKCVARNGRGYRYLPEAFREDPAFILAAVAKQEHYKAAEHIPEALLNDQNFVLRLVKVNGLTLKFVNNQLQADKEIVFAAATQEIEAFQFASGNLKNNIDFVKKILAIDVGAYEWLSKRLKENEVLVEFVLKKRGGLLRCVPHKFASNRKFVKIAIDNAGPYGAIQHASWEVRQDPKIQAYASRRLTY